MEIPRFTKYSKSSFNRNAFPFSVSTRIAEKLLAFKNKRGELVEEIHKIADRVSALSQDNHVI